MEVEKLNIDDLEQLADITRGRIDNLNTLINRIGVGEIEDYHGDKMDFYSELVEIERNYLKNINNCYDRKLGQQKLDLFGFGLYIGEDFQNY